MSTSALAANAQAFKNEARKLPPLEQGDHLTRAEFHARYEAMPDIKKAELIEGIVYMPSPVRHTTHARPHALLLTWLGTYHASTPGTDLGDNATVILDPENEVQPDITLRLQKGQSIINDDGYIQGAPELIVEIAASSASYDLHDKLSVYRRNQVREYIVWQVYDQRIDWFMLEEGTFVPLALRSDGVFGSRVFPGLWLDVTAMLTEDLNAALRTLEKGVGSDAHGRFVAQLVQEESR